MKKKDLLKLLENFGDDFEVKFTYFKKISEDVLELMRYPYPYDIVDCEILEGDISYSEKAGYLEVKLK